MFKVLPKSKVCGLSLSVISTKRKSESLDFIAKTIASKRDFLCSPYIYRLYVIGNSASFLTAFKMWLTYASISMLSLDGGSIDSNRILSLVILYSKPS